MADWERTILPDLRELMKLARGAFCDLDVVLEWVVAAAARHVSSARYVPHGVLDRSRREPERFVSAGVDEVTRRPSYALPRERGVIGEPIANPVPPRAARGGAKRARPGGRSAAAGVRGVGDRPGAPSTGLKSRHSEPRRAMDARDATMPIAPTVGGETDVEVILGPVTKRARAVVSTRTPAIEREHDWTETSG